MSHRSVLVWGEALADLIPADDDATRYEAALGGSGFNTALALARCGAPAMLAAGLSTDALGRRFARKLGDEGIASLLPASERPTPLAIVEPLGVDGSASYRFHLDGTAFAADGRLADLPDGVSHLHLTSFSATVGAMGEVALRLAEQARSKGISASYDLNIRPPALPGREATVQAMLDRVGHCDLVKLSAEDAEWLFGTVDEALAALRAAGPGLLLLTEGERGASLHGLPGEPLTVAAPPTVVLDTIGAGDALMGAFLAALSQAGGLGPAFASMSRNAAERALAFAVLAAARTCAVRGCDPPRLTPGTAT